MANYNPADDTNVRLNALLGIPLSDDEGQVNPIVASQLLGAAPPKLGDAAQSTMNMSPDDKLAMIENINKYLKPQNKIMSKSSDKSDESKDDESDDEDTNRTPASENNKNTLKTYYDLLNQAQEKRKGEVNTANFSKAMATLGAGIAGHGAKSSMDDYYNQQIEQANKGVTNIEDLQKAKMSDIQMQQHDPNSRESKSFRKMIEAEFPKISDAYGDDWENVTASDKDKIFDPLKLKETIDARKQQNAIMMGMRQDQIKEKLIQSFKDDLDPNKARAGNLAKSQAMVNAADRVNALFTQFPDYNIPANQSAELSGAIAGLINGGSAQSQHQIDTMTPSSMRGDANKIASWITNQPLGQEQQDFMRMMHQTAMRERITAENQVKTAQVQRLPAHDRLKQIDSDTYNNLLQSFDIDPNQIVKGRYQPKSLDINQSPSQGNAASLEPNEVVRMTSDGRKAIFDSNSKQFLRYGD